MRRSICRSVFLLLGVLPLVSSIAYAAWHRVTVDEASAELHLAATLGMDCQVEDLVTPRPHVTHVRRVRLLDPETGMPLISGAEVRAESGLNGTVFQIESLRIPGDQVSHAWQLLLDRVLKQRRVLQKQIIVVSDRTTLATRDGEVDLFGLRIEAKQDGEATVANVTFKWARNVDELVRIRIVRRLEETKKDAVPATEIRIETGDRPLPCSVFLAGTPVAQTWGRDLQFQGIAWLDEQHGKYTGEVAGNIHGIDLQRVFAGRFPHGMRGMANVRVEQAVFSDSRFEMLQARIACQDGSIDQPLMRSLANQLGVRIASADESGPAVSFDQAQVRFRVNEQGLAFVGMCDAAGGAPHRRTGVLMQAGGSAILREPQQQPQPAVNLLRALAGHDAVSFPLENPACVQLWQWLPQQK
jgi:hypothetical protein